MHVVKQVEQNVDLSTPWRRVYVKFGMSRSAFARAISRHRSKVSRVLKDKEGLISGRDQKQLVQVAKKLHVVLTPDDFMPNGHVDDAMPEGHK